MKLGDTVTVTAVYQRRGAASGDGRKRWEQTPLSAPRAGLYIGKRTLSNGHAEWESSEVGIIYTPSAYLTAALVVFSERERPVFVPWDALEAQP